MTNITCTPVPANKFTRILGIFATFHIVCFSWIFFRADNMDVVGQVLNQIFLNFHPEIIGNFIEGYKLVVILMLSGFILHFIPKNIENRFSELVNRSPFVLKVVYLSLIILLVVQIRSSEIQPFIYFQF